MLIIYGLFIGFYGCITPGTINISLLNLYISKRNSDLLISLFLFALFEFVYVYFSLLFLIELQEQSWFFLVEISSYLLILIMGIWMLMGSKNSATSLEKTSFYRACIQIVIHPQQITFWLMIGVIFSDMVANISGSNFSLFLFLFSEVLGALLVIFCYFYFGKKLIQKFNLNLEKITKILGAFYIFLAVYLIVTDLISGF